MGFWGPNSIPRSSAQRRLRRVGPVLQSPRQFPEPALHAEALSVDPELAAVAADHGPGFPENILSPYLVAQGVEATLRFFLRFRIQDGLEVPNSF